MPSDIGVTPQETHDVLAHVGPLFFEKSFAESWDKSLAKFKALVEAEAPAHV